ncbi:MAG TPA: hypothetical protein PK156_43425, partial [Polyangium sp.]|nr:hypothetical protein [Polyangium sp.]
LETLAAAYPERALRYVDHDLIAPDVHVGYNLVNAVGRLPAEWARPRLLHMSADIRWSEDAVKKWFALFGNECPVDPLAHVPQDLLVGPPSERMLANLTALRGSQKEARHALLEVLWRDFPEIEMPPETLEPHQRESLALLMYVFRSERVMYGHPTLGRMSIEDWTVFFLKRGGRGAFEVLARWAEDGIRVGVHRGWLVILASHKVVTLLDTEQLERIRAIARIGLERPCMSSVSAAASIFRGLSAPLDLGGRLLENVWCDDRTMWGAWLAEDAARALTKMEPSPELDEAITRDLEKAWELRRVKVCRRLIMAVCERQVSWALEMLMERIRGYQGAEDVREIVGYAFNSLYWAKRIDTEMMATILADGDHPLFSMAAGNIVKHNAPELIEILFGQLDSPAQGGATAGEALYALLRSYAIPLDDARIERILEIAPLRVRANIGDVLLMDKVPLARVYEHMKAGLLSEDERIWGPLLDMFLSRRPKGMAGLFEEVLPRIKSKMLRTVMQRELGLPEDAAQYWKDTDDEDDEEPEEDDDDMEDDDEDERLGDA